MSTREIADCIRNLPEGEVVWFGDVCAHKRSGLWWVQQAGAGTQFSRSPEAAARKVRALCDD